MLFEKTKSELQDEIIRLREMDYFKYHSFLNALNDVFDKNMNEFDDQHKSELIDYTKEIIKTFSEIYGHKRLSESFRKDLQEIIILKDWNYN